MCPCRIFSTPRDAGAATVARAPTKIGQRPCHASKHERLQSWRSVHAWACLIAILNNPGDGAVIWSDDDCILAARSGTALVDWEKLQEALHHQRAIIWEPLVLRVRQHGPEARKECPLGWSAACLTSATAWTARACLEGVNVQQMLAARWPLFKQLGQLQRKVDGTQKSCDNVFHPSLDWADFRRHVSAFAVKVPPWLDGLAESEEVPVEFNQALSQAQGVVWKASSAASTGGRSIADWTADCAFGVLSANAIRAASIVLGDADVYRIVQRVIENLERAFIAIEDIMLSDWPLFDVLHVLSLLKKHLHDMELPSSDLAPSAMALSEGCQTQSKLWCSAGATLDGAAGDERAVFLTAIPHYKINFLQPLFKRSHKLGFLHHIAVIPLLQNVTKACVEISNGFMASQLDIQPRWSPCLPFVSRFAAKAQFTYVRMAIQLGLLVLWFDFQVFWVQSPLKWVVELKEGNAPLLAYHTSCRRKCRSELPVDIFAVDEFYAAYRTRPSLAVFRPTASTCTWLQVLLQWLCSYPFAQMKAGFQYLLHPHSPDSVPSMSMLPDHKGVPPVVVAELDAEQRFVGTDGWFGRPELVMSFEVGPHLAYEDQYALMDRLYGGSEVEVLRVLLSSRKMLSPMRPTQHLMDHAREATGSMGAPEVCTWQQVPGAYLGGYAAGVEDVFPSAQEAQCECLLLGAQCRGVTCEDTAPLAGCTLRQGDPFLAASPTRETSHVKVCSNGGCEAPEITRIVHVNFADGCCEVEQKQSSETAVEFGAHESRPLRGDFLDPEFRQKNHVLLTFNRTPELTQHKTPSGKIGYYVWKPYVVLKTVEDPNLPWYTTVVAWTDAGIHFVSDMRPLVQEYLRESDVSATRTPMQEADFSKRDAFIILDADYESIIHTNQVATGIILVRKTPLAIDFLSKWLKACEDRRIMTEEPSVLGAPDYFSFLNNNDDQTAFSLLFKKFGFRAFSAGERDAVVYTGRNLAKFVKASDDFALGRQSDRDAYLKAADSAAAGISPQTSRV